MTRPKPYRSLKDRVHNPQGRIDWLVAQLIGELVKRKKHPLLSAAYEEFQPELELAIVKSLGPRNKHAKMIGRAVRISDRALTGGRP